MSGSYYGAKNPMRTHLFGETVEAETEVALVEVRPGFDLPGEEAPAEGSVRDYCDPKIFGCCDD